MVYNIEGTSAGEIKLYSNGTLLNTTSITASGDWNTWKDVVVSSNIHFTKGENSIQTLFSKSGFNLNYINFELVTVDDVANVSNAEELKVFPNPTADNIFIQSNKNQPVLIQITDINGKLVFTNSYSNTDNITIDLSSYDRGIYIVKLISENACNTTKIVRQ